MSIRELVRHRVHYHRYDVLVVNNSCQPEEARYNDPCFNPPRLPIQPIGGTVHDDTPDVLRATYRELNEPIVTRRNWLSAELPVNVETVEDIFTRLESLEYVQR